MSNIVERIHCCESPRESESLLGHYIDLLEYHLREIRKAGEFCKKVGLFKEKEEQKYFSALGDEYEHVFQKTKNEIHQLLERMK